MTKRDDDLFDYAARLAAAKAARDQGMEFAEQGAAPGWSELMYGLTIEIAKRQQTFTADDVFDLAEQRAIPKTKDGRAFAPVMASIARKKLVCKAPVPGVQSRRKSCHASPITVWQSLIFQTGEGDEQKQ